MLELHLRQQELTYKACGPFIKRQEFKTSEKQLN